MAIAGSQHRAPVPGMRQAEPVRLLHLDQQHGEVFARNLHFVVGRLNAFEALRQSRSGMIRRHARSLPEIASPREIVALRPGCIGNQPGPFDAAGAAKPQLDLRLPVIGEHPDARIGFDDRNLGRPDIGMEPQQPAVRIECAQYHHPRIGIGRRHDGLCIADLRSLAAAERRAAISVRTSSSVSYMSMAMPVSNDRAKCQCVHVSPTKHEQQPDQPVQFRVRPL